MLTIIKINWNNEHPVILIIQSISKIFWEDTHHSIIHCFIKKEWKIKIIIETKIIGNKNNGLFEIIPNIANKELNFFNIKKIKINLFFTFQTKKN
jgi:hypothetical protein